MPTVTTTHWDITKVRARGGQIYIMPCPTTAPADITTPAAILASYFLNFFTDAKKQALITGLQPWAYVDSKGLILDPKYKPIKFNPAVGLPINVGKYLESLTGELNIGDVSTAKFAELLSATTNEVLTVSTTGTGYSSVTKKGIMIGTQPFNLKYMMLFRTPSVGTDGNVIPGEWDLLLLPRVTFNTEPKLSFTQGTPQDYKVSVEAESDLYLVSPDSGLYAAAYFEETTAVVAST